MDRTFAELMMRHADAIDLHLGAMSEIVREHAGDDVKRQMLDGIFKCVNDMYENVSRPIAKVYPDLHPDK